MIPFRRIGEKGSKLSGALKRAMTASLIKIKFLKKQSKLSPQSLIITDILAS